MVQVHIGPHCPLLCVRPRLPPTQTPGGTVFDGALPSVACLRPPPCSVAFRLIPPRCPTFRENPSLPLTQVMPPDVPTPASRHSAFLLSVPSGRLSMPPTRCQSLSPLHTLSLSPTESLSPLEARAAHMLLFLLSLPTSQVKSDKKANQTRSSCAPSCPPCSGLVKPVRHQRLDTRPLRPCVSPPGPVLPVLTLSSH